MIVRREDRFTRHGREKTVALRLPRCAEEALAHAIASAAADVHRIGAHDMAERRAREDRLCLDGSDPRLRHRTKSLERRSNRRHVAVHATIGVITASAGAIAAINMNFGPNWYPIALAVTGFPCVWLGGVLHGGRGAMLQTE